MLDCLHNMAVTVSPLWLFIVYVFSNTLSEHLSSFLVSLCFLFMACIAWKITSSYTFKVSSDTILGLVATLIFKLFKMKLFSASQRSVVHFEAGLTSNQSPVLPAKIFRRFIDTVVCSAVCHSLTDLSRPLVQKFIQKQFFARIFRLFPVEPHHGMLQQRFSCLSEIRREKFALQAMPLYFCCTFFAWRQLFRCHVWPTFHPAAPYFFIFCFSPTLYAHSLLKNEYFSNVHG